MTERLYYKDAYETTFTALVQEVKTDHTETFIRLDRTAFYPEGGGQGPDKGLFVLPDGSETAVLDVQESEGEIWHKTEAPVAEGTFVTGKIDWEHRFDHMQQHSGEHIVSGMICSRFHCDNVGFHLGEDLVTIDYNARISFDEALEIEAQANRYIWEDHPFIELRPSEEELSSIEFRSKKELSGDVRIARFPGADTCACCGTHVKGSAQIGLVKFISAKKFHDGTRLELLCGKRAMDYLVMNHRENKKTAVLLSTSEENTSGRIEGLIEENKQLKAENALLEEELFSLRAESFRDKGDVVLIEPALSFRQGRTLADKIADCCGGTVAMFVRSSSDDSKTACEKENGYQYILINKKLEIGDLVKALNAGLNGRGGGRNGFAQGSVKADKREIRAFFDTLK